MSFHGEPVKVQTSLYLTDLPLIYTSAPIEARKTLTIPFHWLPNLMNLLFSHRVHNP